MVFAQSAVNASQADRAVYLWGPGWNPASIFCRTLEAKLLSWNVAIPEFLSSWKTKAISCVTAWICKAGLASRLPACRFLNYYVQSWEQVEGVRTGIRLTGAEFHKKETLLYDSVPVWPGWTCVGAVRLLHIPAFYDCCGCKSGGFAKGAFVFSPGSTSY